MIDVFFQGYEAALLFVLGIPTGLFLDLATWIRARCGTGAGTVMDALCVLAFTGLLLLGTLLASNGDMRLFYALCMAGGAAVTAWAFYPLFFRKLAKNP